MYSYKFIKENFDVLKQRLKLRGAEETHLDQTLKSIETLNSLQQEIVDLNTKRNKLIEQDARGNADEIRKVKEQLADLSNKLHSQEQITKDLVDSLPNIPDESLTGQGEIIRSWGVKTSKPLSHHEIAKKLSLTSFEEGVSISGSGFVVYKDRGAELYRALISFTLDLNKSKGYEERWLPVLLLPSSLYGTAQLPKFEEDLFKTTDGKYLSPTSESQLVNIYRNQILEASKLPIKLTANTTCFRKEAGAAGTEDAGIIRLHQFSKTEIVSFCREQDSFQVLEQMVLDASSILEALNLPYQVVQLAYDDMGFAATKTYDIEVWFPAESRYREISSVSNTLNFQSLRAKIRYKENLLDKSEKAKYPHLLNGSSLAIDRLFAAILENYQQEDGSLSIPEPLWKYLSFKEIRN
ncbi:serine--tRNA ligase [Candidatus Mycoplasma haematohominis]|uniref:Serine--tRNA ligase n=1 Tax=Candidatus Mycoplasma haematohominis TaxID=1494318 RepID=A0A478FT57_9MOLU|nr:serine--tRNA ligase [Candidatus Mycoplasma haemohominis]